jgi:chemotaxis regulatin CheY-phosphate phosphatase CheZ
MSPNQPLWLRAVHRLERAVGTPIESAVRSDAYFDLVTQANRVRARMTKSFEELSEQWLHLFNMPAASEVRRLREQLGRVERQLNRVAKDIADAEDADAAPRPRRNASRPRTPKSP